MSIKSFSKNLSTSNFFLRNYPASTDLSNFTATNRLRHLLKLQPSNIVFLSASQRQIQKKIERDGRRKKERNKDMLSFVCLLLSSTADVVDLKIMFKVSQNNCLLRLTLSGLILFFEIAAFLRDHNQSTKIQEAF